MVNRSVNNRFLKSTVRAHGPISGVTPIVEEVLRAKLQRGHVTVHMRFRPSAASAESSIDSEAFEAAALEQAGVNYAPVPPRYRSAYFSHIMGGYSAGYYAYIWSEVMDADTEQWFKAQPDNIRANGQHFRDTLLSRGGSADAMQLFRDFRGRDPEVRPLLLRRGLLKE